MKKEDGEWNVKKRRGPGDEERGWGMKCEEEKRAGGWRKRMWNEMWRREEGWGMKKEDGEWNVKKRRGPEDEERGLGMKWEEDMRARE